LNWICLIKILEKLKQYIEVIIGGKVYSVTKSSAGECPCCHNVGASLAIFLNCQHIACSSCIDILYDRAPSNLEPGILFICPFKDCNAPVLDIHYMHWLKKLLL